jgi:hypothetical protein
MLGGLDWFGLMLDWGGAGWIAVVEWIIGNGVSFDPSLPGHYHALLFLYIYAPTTPQSFCTNIPSVKLIQ